MSVSKLIEALEKEYDMQVFDTTVLDSDKKSKNYFIYSLTGLNRSNGKWMQQISFRAVLDGAIPNKFEINVVEIAENLGFRLSINDGIEYAKANRGNNMSLLQLVDFNFNLPYKLQ